MKEKASIGESFEDADSVVRGGIGLNGQLEWFGKDAFAAPFERLVDRGYKFRMVDFFFASDCTCEEPS